MPVAFVSHIPLITDSTFSSFDEASTLSSSIRPIWRAIDWHWCPHGVIQHSLDSLFFWLIFYFTWLVAGRWSSFFWRAINIFLLIGQCFTILWQQPGIQALQVLSPDKQWVNAPPIPGSLVIKYFLFLRSYFRRTLTMIPLSQQPRRSVCTMVKYASLLCSIVN